MSHAVFIERHQIAAGALALMIAAAHTFAADESKYPLNVTQIRIRDPYVYPHAATDTYLMYAQTANRDEEAAGRGVEVYESPDLIQWSTPKLVYERPETFWGGREIWGPEMHRIGDLFYLFVSFNGREGGRGTQILRAVSPFGPFKSLGEEANTPPAQRALDGTPFIDGRGARWLIYCHEWKQINDGAMLAVHMSGDWKQRRDEPIKLFNASDAPWPRPYRGEAGNFITDGPCLYRTQSGKLLMLWSSFTGDEGRTYAIGVAESAEGSVKGPWVHHEKPLFAENGGHCMIFKTFDGQLVLVLHQPNGGGNERARFYRIAEDNDALRLIDPPGEPWIGEPLAQE